MVPNEGVGVGGGGVQGGERGQQWVMLPTALCLKGAARFGDCSLKYGEISSK